MKRLQSAEEKPKARLGRRAFGRKIAAAVLGCTPPTTLLTSLSPHLELGCIEHRIFRRLLHIFERMNAEHATYRISGGKHLTRFGAIEFVDYHGVLCRIEAPRLRAGSISDH